MKCKFQIEHNIHRAVQSCVAEDTNTTVPDSLQSKGKTNKVIFVLFAQKNMFACIVSKKKKKIESLWSLCQQRSKVLCGANKEWLDA
jgi:hypothetical protein